MEYWLIENWKKKIKKEICDAGAFLFQLDYQSNWEVITLWVYYIQVPLEDDGMQVNLENIDYFMESAHEQYFCTTCRRYGFRKRKSKRGENTETSA